MRRKFVKLVFSSSKEKIGGGEGRHSRRYLIANRAQNTRTRMTWHDLGPREGCLTRKGGDRYLPLPPSILPFIPGNISFREPPLAPVSFI